MKGFLIEAYGNSDVIQFRVDLPIPTPGDDEVLVRVMCAGINFMDIHTRQGKYRVSNTYPVALPCVLGMEGSGEVAAVGKNVTHLNVGDRVAWCISWGSYADFVCVPAFRAARIPQGISYETAAAIIFQGSTAHYLVEDVASVKPWSTCLVHAGSGSIGRLLIQMASKFGVEVIATASTPEKCMVAERLGAKHTLQYEGGKFADHVLRITAGEGVDVVFDSVGKDTLRDSFRCCRRSGVVINYGNVSGSVVDLDPIELGEMGSLFLTRPRLADHMKTADEIQRRADAVFDLVLKGELVVELDGCYAFHEIPRIHEMIENRLQVGKAIAYINSV